MSNKNSQPKQTEEKMSEENVTNELLVSLEEARTLLEIAQKELQAQTIKGNKSAGVRARKALRATKNQLHEIVKASNEWGKET
jgi:hypothetical protein